MFFCTIFLIFRTIFDKKGVHCFVSLTKSVVLRRFLRTKATETSSFRYLASFCSALPFSPLFVFFFKRSFRNSSLKREIYHRESRCFAGFCGFNGIFRLFHPGLKKPNVSCETFGFSCFLAFLLSCFLPLFFGFLLSFVSPFVFRFFLLLCSSRCFSLLFALFFGAFFCFLHFSGDFWACFS